MTVDTVTGSTATASLVTRALRGASGEPHGVAVLGVAHDLARHRRLRAKRPAELAPETSATPVIQMDVLADQRRSPAVHAAVAVLLERAEAVAQQQALELLGVGYRRFHDRPLVSPPRPHLLPAQSIAKCDEGSPKFCYPELARPSL